MRLTVLGGCGAWPTAGQACSGYLVDHDGYRILIDPGYAVMPVLLGQLPANEIDAVLVSHGHPDHCADLSPLLRARALGDEPARPLGVFAPGGAVEPVLALDRPGSFDGVLSLTHLPHDGSLQIGPFRIDTHLLPHFVTNLGFRITVDHCVLAYTGDTGPSPRLLDLARDADLLVAEATYPTRVPEPSVRYLSSARQAGENAHQAGAARVLLTHLWPGTDPEHATSAASEAYSGPLDVAQPGVTITL